MSPQLIGYFILDHGYLVDYVPALGKPPVGLSNVTKYTGNMHKLLYEISPGTHLDYSFIQFVNGKYGKFVTHEVQLKIETIFQQSGIRQYDRVYQNIEPEPEFSDISHAENINQFVLTRNKKYLGDPDEYLHWVLISAVSFKNIVNAESLLKIMNEKGYIEKNLGNVISSYADNGYIIIDIVNKKPKRFNISKADLLPVYNALKSAASHIDSIDVNAFGIPVKVQFK